jgi:Trk K+ transport system NAD-binding subunit
MPPVPGEGRILLEGAGRLAAAIAERLVAAGAEVERFVLGEDDLAGGAARLDGAAALVLAADDDAGNVDRALWARRARPALPLVVRVFDESLASYLSATVDHLSILSMSGVAAPVIGEAAARVLAAAEAPRPAPPREARARPRAPVDRVLVWALAGLVLVVAPATAYFASVLELRPIDALYFVWTTVMTVGYGDISLSKAPDGAKVVGMLLMLAGAAFVATLFALLTGWVVTRRWEVLQGRVRLRWRGHVVVAGAGNLGLRVASRLAEAGHRVVVVETDGDARNVAALRAAGHHVIVADATSEPVLALAGVDQAGVVLALTDADAVNLRIALLVRARRGPGRVVMRVTSPELSAHVTERGDGVALSPIAVAAQSFAEAILKRVAR